MGKLLILLLLVIGIFGFFLWLNHAVRGIPEEDVVAKKKYYDPQDDHYV